MIDGWMLMIDKLEMGDVVIDTIDTIDVIVVVCSRQLMPSSNNDERLLHNQMPTIIMKKCNDIQINRILDGQLMMNELNVVGDFGVLQWNPSRLQNRRGRYRYVLLEAT